MQPRTRWTVVGTAAALGVTGVVASSALLLQGTPTGDPTLGAAIVVQPAAAASTPAAPPVEGPARTVPPIAADTADSPPTPGSAVSALSPASPDSADSPD